MKAVNREDVKAFVTKDASEIRELLAYRNADIRSMSLAEATVKKGASTKPHIHATSEEIYYILNGSAEIEIEGEKKNVKKGDAVFIPSGAEHSIKNTWDAELIFLCICSPPYEHGDTEIA